MKSKKYILICDVTDYRRRRLRGIDTGGGGNEIDHQTFARACRNIRSAGGKQEDGRDEFSKHLARRIVADA